MTLSLPKTKCAGRNAAATVLLALSIVLLPLSAQAAEASLEATAAFSPAEAAVTELTTLTVKLSIPKGYHLYSLTRVKAGPMPLKFSIDAPWLIPEGEWHGPHPHTVYDDAFLKNVETHEGEIAYQRQFRVAAGDGATSPVLLLIKGQICDHDSCHNQKLTLQIPLAVKTGAADPARTTPSSLAGEPYPDNRVPGPADPVKKADARNPSNTADASDPIATPRPESMGLFAFLLVAFIAGFGALVTPCVFPMIPITISYFSKYARISTRRSVAMAAVYAGSIIIVFALVGLTLTVLFGANSMQVISTHPAFNVFLVALLVFFAFNLFGLFEIRMPDFLVRRTSEKEQQLTGTDDGHFFKQAAGVFFMAVTFTLVSFTCTVGFIGWVLALASQGETFYPLLGMLSFATAFALPFFFLAVFPGMAARLQGKGGDWMVAVKVIFGFIELAAAFKFISNLDLYYEWGVVSRPFVLSFWTGLFLLSGLYLLRVFALPHNDTETRTIGPVRMTFALLFFALTAVSATGIGHSRPIGGWIDGWLPPVPYPTDSGMRNAAETSESEHLRFIKDDIPGGMAQAAKENKPLFIDFTGYQCTNCRQMESNYFPRPAISQRLSRMILVAAYTDGGKPVHDQQSDYKLSRFKTSALPFYVILDPHTDKVLATFTSLANSESEYVEFLDKGLKSFNKSR